MRGRPRRNGQRAVVPLNPAPPPLSVDKEEVHTKEDENNFQDLVIGLVTRYCLLQYLQILLVPLLLLFSHLHLIPSPVCRYSRYSWITWVVVKCILKVTTWTMLKVTEK